MDAKAGPASHFRLGEFTLDPQDERVWGPAGHVKLGNKAFQVLLRLVEQDGGLVTKDELFSSVWDGMAVSESALTSAVKELRRALGDDPKNPRYIESVYGRGYRLVAQAVVESEPARPKVSAAHPGSSDRSEPQSYPPLLHVPALRHDSAQGGSWLDEVIREEILHALSRFSDFRLVSGSVAENTDDAAQPTGKRDYRLEIRLFRGVGPLGVFARLVRMENGEIIWSDRAQVDPEQPEADIEKLVRVIVSAVLPRLTDDLTRHLPAIPTDAYGRYLQNTKAMRTASGLEAMQEVARRWEELIESHPGFARAYAPLILLLNTDFGYSGLGSTTTDHRGRAAELARRAVLIDPTEPFLHTVMAWCYLWAGEAAQASEHLRQAYDLNPYHRKRLLQIGTGWMFIGDLDRAVELLDKCESLTPFITEAPHEEAGLLHLLLGEYDKAEDCLRRVARPTISSELYRVLAASAAGASETATLARKLHAMVVARWCGDTPPDRERFIAWALFHHPFQQQDRRDWVTDQLQAIADLVD